MMDDFLQFLREPIAQRSLLACVMIGFANGFVSGLVILKKSALQIGTLSCALLPGIAVAVLLFGLTRWSLLTGAVVAALLVAALLIWDSGIFQRKAAAVTIDGEKYTAADVLYYYAGPYIPAEPGHRPFHPAYHGFRCGLHRAGQARPAAEN